MFHISNRYAYLGFGGDLGMCRSTLLALGATTTRVVRWILEHHIACDKCYVSSVVHMQISLCDACSRRSWRSVPHHDADLDYCALHVVRNKLHIYASFSWP